MKWLDVVKKHIKLNPGKSIKELMPEIKKEYYALDSAPKKAKATKKHKMKHHSTKKHKMKHHSIKKHKKKRR